MNTIFFKKALLSVLLLSSWILLSNIDVAKAEAPQEVPIEEKKEVVIMTDPLFEKIAFCESKHNLKAKNPNSTASGEFQFLKGTWNYYGKLYWGDDFVNKDIFSEDNRELAWWVYTTRGTSDWEADPKSYNCWKSEIPNGTHKNNNKK